MKRPTILALDLEGTLVKDALSCFVRPGVRLFLDWCGQAFKRIVIYSAVPDHSLHQVVEILVK